MEIDNKKPNISLSQKQEVNLDKSLKLIAKTSLIALIFILLSKILTYFYRIIIAREFGPEVYGLFSIAVMISGWFIAIFSLGFPEGATRFISIFRGKKENNKIKYVIKISAIFLFFAGIASFLILFLFSESISINFFHNKELIIFLKWFSISVPFSIFSAFFLSILLSFEKANKYSFIRQVLDTGIKLLSLLLLIALGFGYNSIIFSYILGILGMFFVSYFLCLSLIPGIFRKSELERKAKKEITSNLFSYSWPLIFVGIIGFIFSWVDSFMIGYFNIAGKGVYNVGIYNAAAPLAALLIIAPSLFIQLFFPIINKEYARKNTSLIKDISKQITKWIFLLNLPVLLIIVLFPGAFINLFFGKEFLSAAHSLRFLAIGMFFYSLFLVSQNLLSMAGKSKIVLLDIIIAAILNIFLNVILIPKYNINGAAFATMVTYIFWGLISLFQGNHYTSIIPLRRKMFLIFSVSLIPALLLVFIKQFIPINLFTLIIETSLFFLLYLFLIVYTGCLDKKDLMIISSIKDRLFKKKSIIA